MTVAFLTLLSLVACLWLWLLLSRAHRATFRDLVNSTTAIPSASDLPPIDVILAARNEAQMLPKTLPTICRQDYPNLRVILVDDQSDDDSPAVIAQLQREHPNLVWLRAADRPAGWVGKCWAIQQGVEHLKSEISNPKSQISDFKSALLLFTDADVIFHPSAVRQAVSRMLEKNLDMLSLMPRCECTTPIERIGVAGLMTLLAQMFPVGWANDPKKPWCALACGAFMLVRREAYERIGGHACVRSNLIEDMSLARHLKQSSARVAVHHTPDLVTTRMYESFADLWEGLTKNAYAGMEYQPRKFWVGLLVGLLVSVLPPLYLIGSILWFMHSHTRASLAACGLALLINLCTTLVHTRTIRHLRIPLVYSFFLPLSAALYNLIAVDSAVQHHFRGGNVWKGRRYDRQMLTQVEQLTS